MDNREEISERAKDYVDRHKGCCSVREMVSDFASNELTTYRAEVTAAIEKAETALSVHLSKFTDPVAMAKFEHGYDEAINELEKHLGQGEKESTTSSVKNN
jgi:hypothetical protein